MQKKNVFADDELYEDLYEYSHYLSSNQEWLDDYYHSFCNWRRMGYMGGIKSEWSEEKEAFYKLEVDKFKTANLRIPTLEEEQEIWEHVLIRSVELENEVNDLSLPSRTESL